MRFFAPWLLAFVRIWFLRGSGKRTLSRMTPFDMIIPLTLGPILTSTILLPQVALVLEADGEYNVIKGSSTSVEPTSLEGVRGYADNH